MRFVEIRESLVRAITTLGTPSEMEGSYFRFQHSSGGSKTTTLVVYGENIGGNLIELAFNIEALAVALKREPEKVRPWVAAQRAATGRDVHENPRWQYDRVGIGNEAELTAFLAAWRELEESAGVQRSETQPAANGFMSIPYYVEFDGSKTFFLPDLKRTKGYQVGVKNDERYFADYWDALAFLKNMKAPAFRRPNAKKIAGIVRCQPEHAEDVSVSYLQRLLIQAQTKETRHD